METTNAAGREIGRDVNNTTADSKKQKSAYKSKVESIEVVTSISNVSISEDGSITPTPATVVGTSLFENGVLAVTVQQDPALLKSSTINAIMELSGAESTSSSSASTAVAPLTFLPSKAGLVSEPTVSGISLVSTSSSPGATEQQQQQQQQQQRQRELHFESANAVLVPPLNFALVAPGIYRSGHPNKHNFPFMKKLGLKVIV